jgi:hypothetical protein
MSQSSFLRSALALCADLQKRRQEQALWFNYLYFSKYVAVRYRAQGLRGAEPHSCPQLLPSKRTHTV